MGLNFLKQRSSISPEEQNLQSPPLSENEANNRVLPSVEAEDLSAFCLGRCCLREACYFATPSLKMRFCPYCALEMKTVYDYFKLFHLPSNEPFSLLPAKKRYRQLLSMFHPDLDEKENGDEKEVQNSERASHFLLVSEAWQTLGNDDLRHEYRKTLAKCRTSLLMEQDFADGKASQKNAAPRSPFFSRFVVNSFLAMLCVLASTFFMIREWGDVWMMLGGVSTIFLTLIFFDVLHNIFFVTIVGGFLFFFCDFLLQEKWEMTFLFFAGLIVFLHGAKKWKHSLKVQE